MNKLGYLVLAACASFPPQQAFADSSLNITLRAHVDVFCRIFPPADDHIVLQNAAALIGQVREICNTPMGYDVLTSFSNVSSAKLLVGNQSYAVVNGSAIRSSDKPAVQSLQWSLSDAKVRLADAPVVMQVTITPR